MAKRPETWPEFIEKVRPLLRALEAKGDVSELAKAIRHDIGEALSRGEIPSGLARYKVIGDICQDCINSILAGRDT